MKREEKNAVKNVKACIYNTWAVSISNTEILKRIIISGQSNKASHSANNETYEKSF